MKGKNILVGTGVYLAALWALYGTKAITFKKDYAGPGRFTYGKDGRFGARGTVTTLAGDERGAMFGRDEFGQQIGGV